MMTDDNPIFTGLTNDLFQVLDVLRKKNLQFKQMAIQSTLEFRL